MFNLTRQQQQFVCAVLLLLLVGWAVKSWRAAHPPPAPVSSPATSWKEPGSSFKVRPGETQLI